MSFMCFQMPPRSRVRGAGRVRLRRVSDVGQPSRAPPVDEEVDSYVGEPLEGNPISVEAGASNASVLGETTSSHRRHPPSDSNPPAPTASHGDIHVPPQHPPPAHQVYPLPPPPGYYPPPPYYAPPPAGAPPVVPPGSYPYLYFYPPAWGVGLI